MKRKSEEFAPGTRFRVKNYASDRFEQRGVVTGHPSSVLVSARIGKEDVTLYRWGIEVIW